jgi:uncharacterized protein YktB (UPF0637 family)
VIYTSIKYPSKKGSATSYSSISKAELNRGQRMINKKTEDFFFFFIGLMSNEDYSANIIQQNQVQATIRRMNQSNKQAISTTSQQKRTKLMVSENKVTKAKQSKTIDKIDQYSVEKTRLLVVS